VGTNLEVFSNYGVGVELSNLSETLRL